jgi:TetR/AcrR family transcriptional regulator, transcriptional repressor for nem operon
MSTRLGARQDTRTALLQAGMDIMLEKGYTNTGIQEVLMALGVPKGSFYHYFESKVNFAVAIIQHLGQECITGLSRALRNPQETPLQRLKSYCVSEKESFLSQECRKGCLIGNLGQEMSDQSETLRRELSAVMSNKLGLFAQCIEEGQKMGEITQVCSAGELAQLFFSGWAGAIMHAKTVKNIEPMETFIDLMFNHFLKA